MDKQKSRRAFVELGLKTAVVIPFLPTVLSSCNTKKEEAKTISKPVTKPLKILILGGTSFLGPHQIAYALSKGHIITIFTRGKTQPSVHEELFEQVEQLVGDRNDDLTALNNRKWDAVIDNSGHNAEWTKKSAALLKENCELYLYTSSTGVYYPYVNNNYKEDAKVLLTEPEGIVDEDLKIEYWYGVMKANSELEAIQQFGEDKTSVVRPTYMIGPADKTNRFIHWPIRLKRGGEILLPGKETDMVQYVDVRDVAEWMIRLIEDKNAGTYNAVGPSAAQNVYAFAEAAKNTFDNAPSFVKINDYEFLKANNVHYIIPWIMPIENNAGSAKVNNNKAKQNGLSFRPLQQSIKDTYYWWKSDAVSEEVRSNIETDITSVLGREKTILEKWKTLSESK